MTPAQSFVLAVGWTLSLLAGVLAPPPLRAREGPPSVAERAAEALFEAQRWEDAAAAYRRLVEAEPENGAAWFRLGSALHQLKRWDEAITAYDRAAESGADSLELRASAAIACARSGRIDAAFGWLDRAIDAGLTDNVLRGHPGLAALRSDSRFASALKRAEANRPCRKFEHHQLDFWQGSWVVLDPRGNHVGSSRVRVLLDGCAVEEDWISRAGTRGRSTLYFDPASRRWRLLWVDDGGGAIEAEGEFRQGALELAGSHVEAGGRREAFRLRLQPLEDGRVRQFMEQSPDGGSTWYTWFEGLYVPRSDDG